MPTQFQLILTFAELCWNSIHIPYILAWWKNSCTCMWSPPWISFKAFLRNVNTPFCGKNKKKEWKLSSFLPEFSQNLIEGSRYRDPKRAGRIKAPSIKTFWFYLSQHLLFTLVGVERVKHREGGDAALGKMFKWEFRWWGSLTERLSKLCYFSVLISAGKIHTFYFLMSAISEKLQIIWS